MNPVGQIKCIWSESIAGHSPSPGLIVDVSSVEDVCPVSPDSVVVAAVSPGWLVVCCCVEVSAIAVVVSAAGELELVSVCAAVVLSVDSTGLIVDPEGVSVASVDEVTGFVVPASVTVVPGGVPVVPGCVPVVPGCVPVVPGCVVSG